MIADLVDCLFDLSRANACRHMPVDDFRFGSVLQELPDLVIGREFQFGKILFVHFREAETGASANGLATDIDLHLLPPVDAPNLVLQSGPEFPDRSALVTGDVGCIGVIVLLVPGSPEGL